MITVMNASEANTPMIRQYQDIKSRCRDAILFFRLGDFYEMFYEDAKIGAKELELTLTGRGDGEKRMPMCGVPYHAADNYISKLLSKGYKVAICDQVEDPKDAKGIVKREIVKIITPGTVQESRMLDERASNYLLALSFQKNEAGIAYIDATTGEFKVTSISISDGTGELLEEIMRISPSEILFPDVVPDIAGTFSDELRSAGYSLSEYKDIYDADIAQKRLKEHFKIASLDSFGLSGFKPALGAAVAIIEYLKNTQKGALDHINKIRTYSSQDFMYIDSATRRNLELLSTVRDRSEKGSLVWVLDRTSTVMGSRLLKREEVLTHQSDCQEECPAGRWSGLLADWDLTKGMERETT